MNRNALFAALLLAAGFAFNPAVRANDGDESADGSSALYDATATGPDSATEVRDAKDLRAQALADEVLNQMARDSESQ